MTAENGGWRRPSAPACCGTRFNEAAADDRGKLPEMVVRPSATSAPRFNEAAADDRGKLACAPAIAVSGMKLQ